MLNPSHSKSFVDFYYGFHERYEEYCTGIGYYNSIVHGNPIFYATIAKADINKLQEAMELILQSDVFSVAQIIALEVYTYPMRLIERYELG